MVSKQSICTDFINLLNKHFNMLFEDDAIPRSPLVRLEAIRAIRAITAFRRKRERLFGENLFADAVWDMLLDLYAQNLMGKKPSVSSLCLASCTPPTTALRWIVAMEQRHLIVREPDPHDSRRSLISLSPEALESMQLLLDDADRRLSRMSGSMSIAIDR